MEQNGDSSEPGTRPVTYSRDTAPPRTRKSIVALLVGLAVWAAAASLALAWVDTRAATAAQEQSWDAQRMLLVALRQDFHGANYSITVFLATRDLNASDLAGAFIAFSGQLVQKAASTSASAITAALNLSGTRLQCGAQAFAYQEMGVRLDPSLLNQTAYRVYFTAVAGYLGTTSAALGNVGPNGTDPLAQLGPVRSEAIREQLDGFYALNANVPFGC